MTKIAGSRFVVFRDPATPTLINRALRKVGMVIDCQVHTWCGIGPRFHWKGLPIERLTVLRDATPREAAIGCAIHD